MKCIKNRDKSRLDVSTGIWWALTTGNILIVVQLYRHDLASLYKNDNALGFENLSSVNWYVQVSEVSIIHIQLNLDT